MCNYLKKNITIFQCLLNSYKLNNFKLLKLGIKIYSKINHEIIYVSIKIINGDKIKERKLFTSYFLKWSVPLIRACPHFRGQSILGPLLRY